MIPLSTSTLFSLVFALFIPGLLAQEAPPSQPASTPSAQDPITINSGRIAPIYPFTYKPATVAEITAVLQRVHGYLDAVTPMRVVNRETRKEITDFSQPNPQATVERGDFLIMSYE